MNPLAEKYLRKSALPNIFCPGCGHGIILNAYVRAIDNLGIYDKLTQFSGIGCSSWLPVFYDTDVLHGMHGRALALATGGKLANPDRTVVVFSGDGDCVGIGGNHFIHACRRNIDLTVIMMDNNIYGMTGGQLAPTSPQGAITQTSPYGSVEAPFDVCALAMSAGATFVARCSVTHPRQLSKTIEQGIQHKGFSFIHVVSPCPTQAGRYMYGLTKPTDIYDKVRDMVVMPGRAAKMSEEEKQGKIILGILRDVDQPELCDQMYSKMKEA